MMTRKRFCFIVFVLVLALLAVALPAHAIAIGVNRASINFDGVLRGGYAETTITVTTDTDEMIGGETIFEGEAATWLNATTVHQFNFSRSQPYELRVILTPPTDAQLQSYPVNLSIITTEIGRTKGGKLGTSTRASFRVPITISMTGTERIACTVGGVLLGDTERNQPVELKLSVINRGNVQINPDVTVEVFDQLRTKSLTSQTLAFGNRILPTVTNDAVRTFSFDLPPSQYWAVVKVPLCGFSTTTTFDVLEPGEIKDNGDFIRIDAPSWANTGDIVPIKAIFRNRGVRGVRASFKGTITRAESNDIVKVIATEEYVVEPDATAELQTFFNPQVGGQYTVQGKIFYNSKLTTEKSTLINVNGAGVAQARPYGTILIGIVIIIVILVLLILIARRRKRQ